MRSNSASRTSKRRGWRFRIQTGFNHGINILDTVLKKGDEGGGVMEGGCRGGVCGIWSMFGLEVKAPALGSQEDNGKEREKKGRFMDVCVPSQVVGTY